MKRGLRIITLGITSLASGVVISFALAWALELIADNSSSPAAKYALVAKNPFIFGPFIAIGAAALVFIFLQRRTSSLSLGAVFGAAFYVGVLPPFYIECSGAEHGNFDSIGLWYTVYCAVIFALLFAVVIVAVAALTRVIRESIAARRPE